MAFGETNLKSVGDTRSLKLLIDAIISDASSVPLRVSLGTLARLRSYRTVAREVSASGSKVRQLADVIATAALDDFHQLFEAFLSLTSVFGYEHVDCCLELADKISDTLELPPESIDRKQWVSACESLANTSIAAFRAGKESLGEQLKIASLRFADAVGKEKYIKAYDARAIAKAYIQANLPERALEAIQRVEKKYIDHWLLYRKADAERAMGDFERAVSTATDALENALQDPKAKSHLASYHSLLSKCYEGEGRILEAIEEERKALIKCDSGKYADELSNRIKDLEKKLK